MKCSDWINRLSPTYGAHWKKAGIYDAILLFMQSVNRDENMLATAPCFQNSATNTFDFRVGLMSPTLLDMAQIFGFKPHGRPANIVGDYHRMKNGEKLGKKNFHSATLDNPLNISASSADLADTDLVVGMLPRTEVSGHSST